LSTELSYDPGITLLSICPGEMKVKSTEILMDEFQSSFTHTGQKVEAIQTSINGLMDENIYISVQWTII
jgi:hypothetical protein